MKVHIQHCDLHLRKNLIEKRQRFRPMDKLHFQTFVGRNPHDSLHQPQHDQNDQSRNDSRSQISGSGSQTDARRTPERRRRRQAADMPFGKHDCTRAQKADTGNHGSGNPSDADINQPDRLKLHSLRNRHLFDQCHDSGSKADEDMRSHSRRSVFHFPLRTDNRSYKHCHRNAQHQRPSVHRLSKMGKHMPHLPMMLTLSEFGIAARPDFRLRCTVP